MRKLILWNMVTLDGFCEGRKNLKIRAHINAWAADLFLRQPVRIP